MAALEARLGYSFRDRALLERALTHASVGEGSRKVRDNERLEFLGDRVLGLVTADYLTERFVDAREGQLSPTFQTLVSREACARAARAVDLGSALQLSPAETRAGGREKDTVLGDACEALLAAVYRDGGLEAARSTFFTLWAEQLDSLGAVGSKDAKSALQEWVAGRFRTTPAYAVVDRQGPDHAPSFTVEVSVPGVAAARGVGSSRQAAEKAAAHALLDQEVAR